MVKNRLQTACNAEMSDLLGRISDENSDTVRPNFPIELFSKSNLSADAQQKFDNILKVFTKTSITACQNFTEEIETKLHTTALETLYYKMKIAEMKKKLD